MELWIRSQDKSALNCVKNIRINGVDIMCYNGEVLGTYSTRERALEVLTEIQKIISPQSIRKSFQIEQEQFCNGTVCLKPELNDVEIFEFSSYVYDMPEE